MIKYWKNRSDREKNIFVCGSMLAVIMVVYLLSIKPAFSAWQLNSELCEELQRVNTERSTKDVSRSQINLQLQDSIRSAHSAVLSLLSTNVSSNNVRLERLSMPWTRHIYGYDIVVFEAVFSGEFKEQVKTLYNIEYSQKELYLQYCKIDKEPSRRNKQERLNGTIHLAAIIDNL